MASQDRRRAAARRRAWGRGPTILRFEPLEGRQLLSTATDAGAAQAQADLVATLFSTPHNLDWGDSFHATGAIKNQGDATVTVPFTVDVYATPSQAIGSDAVLVGTIQIPAGLTPGSSASFDQVLNLPPAPIPDLNGAPSYYLALKVNPDQKVAESDTSNNEGQGQGFDESVVTITPHMLARLVGGQFAVTPETANWGDTVTISALVHNNGAGAAPQTRARIVLTPAGQAVGGPADVTIGSLTVPAVQANQGVAVSQAIKLPAAPPSTLAGATNFTVTMYQDADHQVSNETIAPSGLPGVDQATLTINPATTPATAADKLPDLALASVQGPTQTLTWGQPFQVAATVQNTGHADVGPFKVRFSLEDDATPNAAPLALVDTTIPGLKAGYAQDLLQTVTFGGKLPDGLNLGDTITGHVIVQIDPEHTLDEASVANNVLQTGPVTLNLVGTDGSLITPVPPGGPAITPAPPTPAAPQPAQSTPITMHPTITPAHTTAKPKTKPHATKKTVHHPAHAPHPHILKLKKPHQLRVYPGGVVPKPKAASRKSY
jgi:hypothetical protein